MRPWDRVVVILMWMLFWACCAGAIFLIVAGINGCTPAAVGSDSVASHCYDDIYAETMRSPTCTEAQIRVDVLLRASKSCRDLYGDAGLDVCAKYRAQKSDGGTDAARR